MCLANHLKINEENKVFQYALKDYRDSHNYSQEEMVDLLASFDQSLENLDRVTYSRWERGISSPSLDRKFIILKELYLFETLEIEVKKENQKNIQDQEKLLDGRFAVSSLGVDNVYVNDETILFIKTKNLTKNEYAFFLKYGRRVLDHELMFDESKDFNSKAIENVFFSYYNVTGLLLGHAFFHIINSNYLAELIPEFDNDVYFKADDMVLFIGSSFASTRNAILTTNHLTKDLLLKYKNIKYIYVRIFNSSLFELHSLQGAKVIDKSEECEVGISYKKKKYKWIGVIISFDDFLKNNALLSIELDFSIKQESKPRHFVKQV